MKPRAYYTPHELVALITGLLILSAGPIAALAIVESDLASKYVQVPFTLLERLSVAL